MIKKNNLNTPINLNVFSKDWVKLAVNRARASGIKAVFWLDPARSVR